MLWLLIVGMGLLTFALRLALIATLGRIQLSDLLQQALKYVPPAVLSAIVLPELLLPGGRFDPTPGNERLLAGIVAVAVARLTRNVLATIAAGMLVLWFLQWLGAGTGG